jgi:hypothetical protein
MRRWAGASRPHLSLTLTRESSRYASMARVLEPRRQRDPIHAEGRAGRLSSRPRHSCPGLGHRIGVSGANETGYFQEYFQVDNPERDREKGLGLGRAIVKRLVNLLDSGGRTVAIRIQRHASGDTDHPRHRARPLDRGENASRPRSPAALTAFSRRTRWRCSRVNKPPTSMPHPGIRCGPEPVF